MNNQELRDLINSIEGVNSPEACMLLYSLAKDIMAEGVVLEIGSFKGRATISMAKALQETKKGVVYAVESNLFGSKDAFLNNIARCGVKDYVIPVFSDSARANIGWRNPIKLIWLDNDVNYTTALYDFLLWEPYLAVGGAIVFGYIEIPGIRKFVHDHLTGSGRFKNITISSSLVIAYKDKETPPRVKWKINYFRYLYIIYYMMRKAHYNLSRLIFPRSCGKESAIKKAANNFFQKLLKL